MRNTAQQNRKNKTARTLLIAGVVIAALVLIAVIVIGMRSGGNTPDGDMEEATIYGDEYLGIDPVVDEQLQDYRNLVLFGVEEAAGSEGEYGTLSDDFIIVSFNRKTDKMIMVSVYGDAYLKIDDQGFGKVGDAYSAGGMDAAIKAINRNLDLNIREGMALTWDAIATLVDRIGGIEMKMPDGTRETLNGQQAVEYARTDYDIFDEAETDTARMQTILLAALDKAKAMEAEELTPILDEIMPQIIQRSMNRDKVTAAFLEMSVFERGAGISWPYDAAPVAAADGDANGASGEAGTTAAAPTTLMTNVVRLHGDLFGQREYDPTGFVKKTSEAIEKEQTGNGTE